MCTTITRPARARAPSFPGAQTPGSEEPWQQSAARALELEALINDSRPSSCDCVDIDTPAPDLLVRGVVANLIFLAFEFRKESVAARNTYRELRQIGMSAAALRGCVPMHLCVCQRSTSSWCFVNFMTCIVDQGHLMYMRATVTVVRADAMLCIRIQETETDMMLIGIVVEGGRGGEAWKDKTLVGRSRDARRFG